MENENILIPEHITNHWKELTDYNCHAEVRIEIAKYFDDTVALNNFISLKDDGEKLGSMTFELLKERIKFTDDMLNRIKNEYGDGYYLEVIKCL